uniref:Glycosyltransferase n=1 Tax=candidate division WOR-3 bacterium TaxID=2052148 RepID=A0A7V3VTR7_UNCW3
MKVSIITAVFNGADTIQDCIKSVLCQTYKDIEHIIIDGGSTDGTIEIIKKHAGISGKIKWISEHDNGMYDAINKGIKMATGEIIGILNSDDFYAHTGVIEMIINASSEHNVDACYGDLLYVDKNNPEKIIRYWKSSSYTPGKFKFGWHPPHPSFFVRRLVYDRYGLFRTDLSIASDYELMLRFFERYKIRAHYIPEVLVKMRTGGKSNRSLKNILLQSIEDYRAWRMNGLSGGMLAVFLKKLRKAPQFVLRLR